MLARPEEDCLGALEALVDRLGAPETLHETYRLDRPDAAVGALAVEKVWQSLAHHLPEEAIICDESITSGRGADKHLAGAPPHDLLMLTGGAIGIGMPLATGAAIACPDRKVVNTQADGSAMYTIQALWTQAREKLDIVTILFNNRAYRILQGEFRQVEAGTSGVKAQEVMQLDNPDLNFCDIAQGMGVAAARVSTTKQLNVQLEAAMRESGPYLIEVMVP
jgi:acetolactate synthase-1/2/3 large subunit